MRHCIVATAFLAAGALGAEAQCLAPSNQAVLTASVEQGVNEMRQAAGLRPYATEARLAQAAQGHACDMAQNGFFGHQGSNGSNSHRRVQQTGFRTCLTAENIAWGFRDPARIVSGWMTSPGHRQNILLDRADSAGVGVAEGADGPVWVLVISRRC